MKSHELEEIIINSSNWVIANNFVVNEQKLIVNEGEYRYDNNAGLWLWRNNLTRFRRKTYSYKFK